MIDASQNLPDRFTRFRCGHSPINTQHCDWLIVDLACGDTPSCQDRKPKVHKNPDVIHGSLASLELVLELCMAAVYFSETCFQTINARRVYLTDLYQCSGEVDDGQANNCS